MLGGARSATRTRAPSGAPSGLPHRPRYVVLTSRVTTRSLLLHARAFGIFQGQFEFPSQCIDSSPAPLPRALGFESKVTDSTPPWSDDATDRAVVAAVGVILVKPANHIG